MPKYHERERKINALKSGENVRPPKKWWDKMFIIINKEYPLYSKNEKEQVLGGIWNSYSISTKIGIINEYQTDNLSKDSHIERRILGKRNYNGE